MHCGNVECHLITAIQHFEKLFIYIINFLLYPPMGLFTYHITLKVGGWVIRSASINFNEAEVEHQRP